MITFFLNKKIIAPLWITYTELTAYTYGAIVKLIRSISNEMRSE